MDEFFHRLPNGSFRISRAYQQRLQAATERSSRFPDPTAFSGSGGSSQEGPWLTVNPELIVWAEITALPDPEASEPITGYSWRQRMQMAEGEWVAPERMLAGDNGSFAAGTTVATITTAAVQDGVATITTAAAHTYAAGDTVTISGMPAPFEDLNSTGRIDTVPSSTTFTFSMVDEGDIALAATSGTVSRPALDRHDVAFDPNGDETIPTGTIVALVRGHLHVGTTPIDSLPLLDPGHPELGSLPDAETQLGQDWTIIGSAGGGQSPPGCQATCYDNITPASVAVLPVEPETCHVPITYDVEKYCGDFCLNSTACPETTIATLTGADVTSGIATMTTASAHTALVGQTVTLSAIPSPFAALNGSATIASVPSTASFTFATPSGDIGGAATTGTVKRLTASDCTACLKVYDRATLGTIKHSTASGIFPACSLELDGYKYLHGCFTRSDTPVPGGIPVIKADTWYVTIGDDCNAPTVHFEIVYIVANWIKIGVPGNVTMVPGDGPHGNGDNGDVTLVPVIPNSVSLGTWDSGTPYLKGQVVSFATSPPRMYLARGDSTNVEPDTDTLLWQTLASYNTALVTRSMDEIRVPSMRKSAIVIAAHGVVEFDHFEFSHLRSNMTFKGLGDTIILSHDPEVFTGDGQANGYVIHFYVPGAANVIYADDGGDVAFPTTTAALAGLPANSAIYLFEDNNDYGAVQLTTIDSVAGRVITLADNITYTYDTSSAVLYGPVHPTPGHVHAYKWTRGGAIVASFSGRTVTLADTARAADFTPDMQSLMARGIAVQQMIARPYVIETVNLGTGVITFRKQIRAEDFVSGLTCLIPGPRLQKIILRDFIMGGSDFQSGSTWTQGTVGVLMENVSTLKGEAGLVLCGFQVAESHQWVIRNFHGFMTIGCSTDFAIYDSVFEYLTMEEFARDFNFYNCAFYGPGNVNHSCSRLNHYNCYFDATGSSISWGINGQSEKFTYVNCHIQAVGAGGGISGNKHKFIRCTGGGVDFNINADCQDCHIEGVPNAGIRWVLATGSTGTLVNVDPDEVAGDATGWALMVRSDAKQHLTSKRILSGAAPSTVSGQKIPVYDDDDRLKGWSPVYDSFLHYDLHEATDDAIDSGDQEIDLTEVGTVPLNAGGRGPYTSGNYFTAAGAPFYVPEGGVLTAVFFVTPTSTNGDYNFLFGTRDNLGTGDAQWWVELSPTMEVEAAVRGESGAQVTVPSTEPVCSVGVRACVIVQIDDRVGAKTIKVWKDNQDFATPDEDTYAQALQRDETPSFRMGCSGDGYPALAAIEHLTIVLRDFTREQHEAMVANGPGSYPPVTVPGSVTSVEMPESDLFEAIAPQGGEVVLDLVSKTPETGSAFGTNSTSRIPFGAGQLAVYDVPVNYRMDDVSGNATDSGPLGLTLTQHGTVTSVDGKLGKARSAWSASNYFDRAYHAKLAVPPDGILTVRAWVKCSDFSGYRTICGMRESYPSLFQWGLDYSVASNRWRVYVQVAAGLVELPANNYGAVVSGAVIRLKMVINDATGAASIQINDGTPDTTTFTAGTVSPTTSKFYVGYFGDGGPFDSAGWIDDIKIDQRAWTAEEDAADWNRGVGATWPLFLNLDPRLSFPTALATLRHARSRLSGRLMGWR